MPEQLRLEQLRRQRRAVDGHERALAPLGQRVDGARHQLLAGARLAGDEHGGVRSRRRARRRGTAAASAPSGRPSRPAASGASARSSARDAAGPHLRQRRVDRRAHLLVGERLDQVLVRAEAHRLHRRLHRRVGGHHDHLHVEPRGAHAAQQLDAVHARHRQVAQHHVGRRRSSLRSASSPERARVDLAPPLVGDENGQRAAHVGLVVDDEDARAPTSADDLAVLTHRRESGMPQLKWMRPGKCAYHGDVFQRSSASVCVSG